jgi:hypothetical protein
MDVVRPAWKHGAMPFRGLYENGLMSTAETAKLAEQEWLSIKPPLFAADSELLRASTTSRLRLGHLEWRGQVIGNF